MRFDELYAWNTAFTFVNMRYMLWIWLSSQRDECVCVRARALFLWVCKWNKVERMTRERKSKGTSQRMNERKIERGMFIFYFATMIWLKKMKTIVTGMDSATHWMISATFVPTAALSPPVPILPRAKSRTVGTVLPRTDPHLFYKMVCQDFDLQFCIF